MTDGALRLSRQVRWVDVAVVVPILALMIAGTANIEPEDGGRAVDALAFVCAVTGAVALVVWRRWAIATIAVVALTTAVYVARSYPGGPALLPGPLALLAVGYSAPRRVGWFGAAGYVAAAVVANLVSSEGPSVELIILPGWASAALLAGQALAARGERAAAARERAAHAHQQAVAAERLRIAQDLHDSVAHAMATINVQSGVAAHLLDREPGQAKGALEAIRSASSDALDELGAILGVLREPGGAAPRAPTGMLDDVGTLADRARADGLDVTVRLGGDTSAVAPSVSAAAYRVVQEALTNVRRHAGNGAAATVDVTVGAGGTLDLRVADNGRGPQTTEPSGGFGLIGMRERVSSTGGQLHTGARPGGGFEVVATWENQ